MNILTRPLMRDDWDWEAWMGRQQHGLCSMGGGSVPAPPHPNKPCSSGFIYPLTTISHSAVEWRALMGCYHLSLLIFSLFLTLFSPLYPYHHCLPGVFLFFLGGHLLPTFLGCSLMCVQIGQSPGGCVNLLQTHKL